MATPEHIRLQDCVFASHPTHVDTTLESVVALADAAVAAHMGLEQSRKPAFPVGSSSEQKLLWVLDAIAAATDQSQVPDGSAKLSDMVKWTIHAINEARERSKTDASSRPACIDVEKIKRCYSLIRSLDEAMGADGSVSMERMPRQ